MEEKLILVDMNEREIGNMEKMQTHVEGRLHRAFSIFLIHDGKVLIQKRNQNKYHSGGKWANSCCSHPRAEEALESAAHRRLQEEMGVDCELKEIGAFIYYSKYDDKLHEYEFDHVFIGDYGGEVKPNPEEAEEVRWIEIGELMEWAMREPDSFGSWFITAFSKVLEYLGAKE